MISFLLLLFLTESVLSTKFYLDSNNKFQDILVFINDNVFENEGRLLDTIKDHFNRASKSLWIATSNMDPKKAGVQFGTIYIRVPELWKISSKPITWQQCNMASFIVSKNYMDNSNKPFTKQVGKCGEPAQFTRLPELFFKSKSENDSISAGKDIMNEFLKLRYGVFSEKPENNFLVAFNGSHYIDGVCGSPIQWKLNTNRIKCIEYDNKCNYTIVPNQNHNYSVTFDTETLRSEYFCDEKHRPHNQFAKNLQNRKCSRQSITSVILKHSDFSTNKPMVQFEDANFVIVKGQGRRIALVLDTSTSMRITLDNMRKGIVQFLEEVEESAFVGIVDFNSFAQIHSFLEPMRDDTKRNSLINITMNLQSRGFTNISDGLVKGVQVLGGDVKNSDKIFGTIILMTDGQNNWNQPYGYDFVINQVIKKSILVHSIAYGTTTDSKINKLVIDTGGQYFFADPDTVYLDLLAKLSVKQSCEITVNQEIKVVENIVQIDILEKVNVMDLAYVDDYIGLHLKLTVTLPSDKNQYRITLISPTHKRFSVTKTFSQTGSLIVVFYISGKPDKGMYKLEFTSPNNLRHKRSSDTFTISFTISAKPDSTSQRIINPTGEINQSEIEILSDTTSVLSTIDLTTCGITKQENVSVTLIMDSPKTKNITYKMMDDGMGDDSIEDDKIFSKLLLAKDLKEVGFYNFRANIDIFNNLDKEIIRRTVDLGGLRVKNKPDELIVDKIPPSKIENVKLMISDVEQMILMIQFLAPGDDGMEGSITNYEVIIHSSTIIHEKMTANASAREIVKFYLSLKTYNITDSFEVSVRGIDNNNNTGEWSQGQLYNWKYMTVIEDKIPPSIITNVSLSFDDERNLKIHLVAPGNDGMKGSITDYEILINSSSSYVVQKTANVSSGEIVEFYMNLQGFNIRKAFTISIRGVDKNDNKGKWSQPQYYNFDTDGSHSGKLIISYKLVAINLLVLLLTNYIQIFYIN